MKKKATTSVLSVKKISPAVLDAAKQKAKKMDRSLAQIIREFLRNWVKPVK